jgi:radical SAM protein with 4Fe4S-binding SPASM domain
MIQYKTNKEQDPYFALWQRPTWLHPIENAKNIRFPLIVTVEPTNRCNLTCLYCSRQLMDRPIGLMSEKVFDKIVNECAKHDSAIRHGGFGEPFLHPKMDKFLEMSNKAGVLTTVFTNGKGMTEKMMQGMVEHQLDEIRFSTSGVTAAEHEHIRKGSQYKKDFEDKIRRVSEIRQEKSSFKPYMTVYSNVMSYEDPKFKAELESYQTHFLQWADKVDIDLTMFSRVKELDHVKELYEHQTVQEVHKPCVDLFLKIVVHWNGDVFACDKIFNRDEIYLLGNLEEEGSSIEEMVQSSKMQALRQKLSFGKGHMDFPTCKDCFSNTTKWSTEETEN